MRRHIIPILMISGIIIAVVYVVLNTTLIFSFLIPHFVKSHYKDIRLRGFHIQGQSFQLPDKLTLYGASFVLEVPGRSYEITLKEASIYDIAKYETNRRNFRFYLEGLNVAGGGIRARNFNMRLLLSTREAMVSHLDGIFQGEIFDYLRFRLENIEARCRGDLNKLQIFEVTAQGYGGQGRGQLSLEKSPGQEITLWLELFGMDPKALQALDKSIFSQIEGKVDGTFRVIQGPEKIDLLAVNFTLPSGGTLKPGLMAQVVPFIVDPQKEALVQNTIQKIGAFPVDKASLDIQNVEPNKLIAMFSLENKEFDLPIRGNKELAVKQGFKKFVENP